MTLDQFRYSKSKIPNVMSMLAQILSKVNI